MALNYIQVTGTYLKPDGVTPNAGYIEFRPNVALAVSGAGVVFPEPLRAILDENGHFTINLMATDNPTIAPTGWLWFVDEKVEHGNQWYLATISKANGGSDPLDISYVFYPPGAVGPPTAIKPGPAGIVGPAGKDAVLYESTEEPIEGISVGTFPEFWVDTDETVDGTVEGILRGTHSPTDADGTVGNFYLDTDDQILYGPRVADADSIISASPFNLNAIAGSTRSWGLRFQVLRPGKITGLRFFRSPNATQTTRTLTLWSDTGTILASANTSGEFGGGWIIATLAIPYTVSVGTYYRVSYNVLNTAYYVYSPETPTTTSVNFTDLLPYTSTGIDTFPNSPSASNHTFADVVFQSDDMWPVALKSVPPGGITAQVLSKLSGTDYHVGWATVAAGGGGGSGSTTILHVDPDITGSPTLLVRDDQSIIAIPPAEAVRPAPPTGITTLVKLSYIKLTWTPSVGAVTYYVYRNGVFLSTTTSLSYRDESIQIDTPYTYTFRAANNHGMRGALSAGVNAQARSIDNMAPTVQISVWPLVNQAGQKQVVRVTAVDVDAQTLAVVLNASAGSLESTADPSVWLLLV